MQCFLRPELNPLLPGVPFLHPKNTSENLRFFDDYNRYIRGAPGSTGQKYYQLRQKS